MPPQIALLLCFVFILALFKIDHKAKSDVSAALWVPTIWVIILASRMVSEWFSITSSLQSTEQYAEGSPLDRSIFLSLIAIASVILIRRRINFVNIIQNNVWISLFLLYCGISIAWSDFPLVSFKRYIKEIGNFLMVLIVLSENAPTEAIKTLVKRCAYLLIPLSIVLYKYYPALGRAYGRHSGGLFVTGVTTNKNSLGVLCAISGIILFWNLLLMRGNKSISLNKQKGLAQIVILAMTIWLLWIANSATSNICFVLGICILVATRMEGIRKNIKFYTLSAILIVSVSLMMFDSLPFLTGALGRDETLTGRTEVWKSVLEINTNPMFGVGYGSFWLGNRLERLWEQYWWHPTEAHNGYLEVYLQLGIIGVIIVMGVIFSAFRTVFATIKTDFEYGSLQLAMLTVATLYNVTESAFRVDLLMYFVFILVVMRFPRSDKLSRVGGTITADDTFRANGNKRLEELIGSSKKITATLP